MTEPIEFANPAIGEIFFGALNMTHSKCDGCEGTFPLRELSRWGYEFSVCADCKVQCQSGRMSFRIDSFETYEEYPVCTDCERPMALSKFRTIDGVEKCIFKTWPTCKPCLDYKKEG